MLKRPTLLKSGAGLDKSDADATYRSKYARFDLPDWSRALPRVMSSPPTVSYSAGGAATALANPKDWAADVAFTNLRVYGGTTVSMNASGSAGYIGADTVGNEFPAAWFVEFLTDAPKFEVCYLGSAGPGYRLEVNGEDATASTQTATGGSGQQHRMTADFGGVRQMRRIRIKAVSLFISKITTTQADTLAPPAAKAVKALVLGDSYSQGGGVDNYWLTTCALLGWDAPMGNASGGTGYNATGPGGRAGVFSGRTAAVIAAAPDIVLVAGGINDSAATLQADASTVFAALRAGLPNAKLFAVGPWEPSSASAASQASKGTAIAAAAAANGVTYIDNLTVPWVTGSGTSAAPANDGNADIVIGSDGTHPTIPDGHRVIAARTATALAGAMSGV